MLAPHPRVDAVRGCVALARGPVVYCIEQPDQPAGVAVEDLRVDPAVPPQAAGADDAGCPSRSRAGAVEALGRGLYRESTPPRSRAACRRRSAIPYFRWANRGPNAMRVWIPTA